MSTRTEFDEARRKLRLYYAIQALIAPESSVKCAAMVVVSGGGTITSMPERWAWKVISLESRILDVQAALDALSEEYLLWLQYRYRDEYSVKRTMQAMGFRGMPLRTAYTLEETILSEFVKHLPC